jgi:hypothetical protein
MKKVTMVHGDIVFRLCRNPNLSCDSVIFFGNYEGDPLSPPEGEAAQGEYRLDPALSIILADCRFFPLLPERYRICAPSPNGGLVAQEGGKDLRFFGMLLFTARNQQKFVLLRESAYS